MGTEVTINELWDIVLRSSGLNVLCGAGVSMIAPTRMPSGNDLRDMCVTGLLSDNVSRKYLRGILKSSSYQRLLPESVLQDIAAFTSDALDLLMVKILEGARPNPVHHHLAANYNNVFTTNFDLCLEKSGTREVIHLHGSIARPSTLQNRVFRLAKTAEEELRRFESDIKGKELLVLGYSLRDRDVAEAITSARPARILYLSYDGVPPPFLLATTIPVAYAQGSAEELFGLKASVSRNHHLRKVKRVHARQPSVARRAAALLYLCFRAAKYEMSEAILSDYLPRLRGRGKYKAICSVADCLRIAGRYDDAVEWCRYVSRSKFANKPEQADLLSSAYVITGLCDLDRGKRNYDQIEDSFQRALAATELFASLQTDDSQSAAIENWKARILNNIGLLFEAKGDYERAILYFKKSLEIKEAHHEERGYAQTMSNLSKVYLAKRDYGMATQALRIVVELMEKSPDVYICRDAILNLLQFLAEERKSLIKLSTIIPPISQHSRLWKRLEASAKSVGVGLVGVLDEVKRLNSTLLQISPEEP